MVPLFGCCLPYKLEWVWRRTNEEWVDMRLEMKVWFAVLNYCSLQLSPRVSKRRMRTTRKKGGDGQTVERQGTVGNPTKQCWIPGRYSTYSIIVIYNAQVSSCSWLLSSSPATSVATLYPLKYHQQQFTNQLVGWWKATLIVAASIHSIHTMRGSRPRHHPMYLFQHRLLPLELLQHFIIQSMDWYICWHHHRWYAVWYVLYL